MPTTSHAPNDAAAPRPLAQRAPSEALGGGFTLPATTGEAGRAAAEVSPAQRSRQGFAVGDLRLMMRYEDGSQLAELPTLYRLPNAPGWCLGMVNLNGALLPVFDLALHLGLETAPAPTQRAMLLVLAHGSEAAGIVIHGLPVRLRLAQAQPLSSAIAPDALAGCIKGAWLIDSEPWLDLDVSALLARLESALAAA